MLTKHKGLKQSVRLSKDQRVKLKYSKPRQSLGPKLILNIYIEILYRDIIFIYIYIATTFFNTEYGTKQSLMLGNKYLHITHIKKLITDEITY